MTSVQLLDHKVENTETASSRDVKEPLTTKDLHTVEKKLRPSASSYADCANSSPDEDGDDGNLCWL